jgi:hypothetical protein
MIYVTRPDLFRGFLFRIMRSLDFKPSYSLEDLYFGMKFLDNLNSNCRPIPICVLTVKL